MEKSDLHRHQTHESSRSRASQQHSHLMSSKAEKLAKLRKLQALKNGKQSADDIDEGDDRLYDIIDEDSYRLKKRQELLQDDFVVDDDGEGYVDRGIEDNEPEYEDSEEDTSKKELVRKKKSKQKEIGDILRTQQAKSVIANRIVTGDLNKKKRINVDEFDDILNDFGSESKISIPIMRLDSTKNSSSSPTRYKSAGTENARVQKRLKLEDKKNYDPLELDSSPTKTYTRITHYNSKPDINTPSRNEISGHDHLDNSMNSNINSDSMDVSELNALKHENEKNLVSQFTIDDDDDDDDEEDNVIIKRRKLKSAATDSPVNLSSKDKLSTSPFVTAPGTPMTGKPISSKRNIENPSESSTSSHVKLEKDDIIDQSSDSFQFFWFDFAEVNNTLLLFGKVKTLSNKYESAMVQVKGVCRALYFLPRENNTPSEIYDEIIPLLMEKYGLEHIRAKPEKMKYAFELPDIPKESEYLKVLLPFDTPKASRDLIPPDLSSDTFYHVFGGNSGLFESFVVQNKIMGPCWLEIKNGDFNILQNTSHCALEVSLSDPSQVTPSSDKDMPPLNALSISVQTILNVNENKQEVVSLTLATYEKLNIDLPIAEDLKPNNIVTLVRPPEGDNFPVGFATLAKQKLNDQVRLFNNEKTLLACFCAMMKLIDPDVLVGHRLESMALDVIAHRVYEKNIPTFSSLGRRVRKNWPDRFGNANANMNHFFVREIMAGRLICDIANEMGQSLTPKCQSWDLAEMYKVACGNEYKPLDVNYRNPQFREEAAGMVMALQENIKGTLIAAEISFRIQILSLTKQLTNLAGNGWSQTLGGTRAGRNEYILLHEFTRNGYIVPDKENSRSRAQRQKKDGLEEPASENGRNSKKAKYQGGLVFEPEKGLHKNYVLVMDYNSLYPSIIQEYNICFTTVERNLNDPDELPPIPTDQDQGVLPRLLLNLVQRRREVKKLMQTETDPHKRIQCDIRQQALKLTANSMYGCLGYVNSRFYAQPLAMLVTNKGREILMNTKQLAESMNLLVVYGDTDSVMIDTGSEDYEEAIKIGVNFKKLVNERYKLLEIDIDNVFRKLLLHAKKKYAALNATLTKDGKIITALEVKGLDMRRREFCPLSREVSINVLNTILSDKDPETALQEIYDYLEEIRKKVEENSIRLDKYKINTRLSKDPSAYPGGNNMPAVQVALRMRKAGRIVKAGTVITFVITKSGTSETEKLSPAERAYALNEVMIKDNNLIPDPEYYLEKQIFAPVERLLERIDGFDVVRLSEALHLDSRKYLKRLAIDSSAKDINELEPLESTISDAERFKDVANFEIKCPKCSSLFPFGGIVPSTFYQVCFNGIQCKGCEHILSPIQITSQLEKCIRSHISLYYAGWLQCDDATCGMITRQMSVFGKRCLNEDCTGVMHYRYSDKQLYNQLLYFDSLFDCDKNKNEELKPLPAEGDNASALESIPLSSIRALAEQNRELFGLVRSIVQKYLRDCARRYVDMTSIFDFMNNTNLVNS